MNVQALLALLVAAVPCVWAACPPGTFNCGSSCITDEFVCDGIKHCWGTDDESQDTCKGKCKPGATFCSEHRRCIPDWIQCANAQLQNNRVYVDCNLDVYRMNLPRVNCNGVTECTDNRDESFCDTPERCARTAFFCDRGCRPRSWLCDGVRTCSDVDDEANCTPTESTAITEVPTSTARTEAPTSTARTEAPTSIARTEEPTSTAITEVPTGTAQTEAPTSTVTEASTSTARTEASTSIARTEAPTSTSMGNSSDTSVGHGPVHVHIHGDAQIHFHLNAGVRTGRGGGVPLLLVLVFLLFTA